MPIVLLIGLLCAGPATPLTHGGILQAASRQSAASISVRKTPMPHSLPHASAPQTQDASPQSESAHRVSTFLHSWSEMSRHSEEQQPDWLSPIATTSGRLKNELRLDVWQPISASGQPDFTLGGGKGLEFIVAPRIQLLVGIPTYVIYPRSQTRDAFGDMPLMLKFRVASAPRKRGDYLMTVLLKATVPTGSKALGMKDAILSPGFALGKGWKQFDVQTTFGGNLPTGDTTRLGRQFTWDTAFQYRAARKFWPEVEVNSIAYVTGRYAGETQAFVTPGLGFGRVHLFGHVGFSAALGFQIAATGFHTYNHQGMVSVRFPF